MKSIILISLLCLSLCASHLRTSTPEYDSLVLAIQWPNGVCASKSSICQEKMSRMKPNTMSLHGRVLKVEKCSPHVTQVLKFQL